MGLILPLPPFEQCSKKLHYWLPLYRTRKHLDCQKKHVSSPAKWLVSSFRRVSTKNATSIARHLVDASVIEITDMGKMRTEKRLVVINHHPGRCIRCHTCFGARWNPGVLPLGKCFWQISLKRWLYVKNGKKRTTFYSILVQGRSPRISNCAFEAIFGPFCGPKLPHWP